ncbi:MAG: endo alpha-1,4 polygalactosaminidase [Aquificaceae bacterium]
MRKVFLLSLFFLLFSSYSSSTIRESLSIGFIYGDSIPEEALSLFNWLVIEHDTGISQSIRGKVLKLLAYVSVGEANPGSSYFNEIEDDWVLGENTAWGSKILDVRKEEYRDFFFNRIISRLEDYDGFFLDTLDSYQLVIEDQEERREYELALVEIIREIRNRYPNKIILINRGFEIVDFLKDHIDGLVSESLFYGLDLDNNLNYRRMNIEETDWLLAKLMHVKSLGIKVIVIDYVDDSNFELRKGVAKRIYSLGFVPYVSDKLLYNVGVGTKQIE